MRPTLRPSARVSELPPVEVRLAALPNSPGNSTGGPEAAGTGGSASSAAGSAAPRGSADASPGSAGGVTAATAAGAGLDLAAAADLPLSGGEVLSLSGSGSATVLTAGVSTLSTSGGWAASPGGLPGEAPGSAISARMTAGSFTAGSPGTGPVGIAGPLPARSSTISRLGLESCEVLTSTAPARSTTMRVVPGLVSATRTRCTSLSPISVD